MARRSLQAEVVASLAAVLLVSQLVLLGVLFRHSEQRLRAWLGPALLAAGRSGVPAGRVGLPAAIWWRADASGRIQTLVVGAPPPDSASRALAARSVERGQALLVPGAPWSPIRFAMPVGEGRVALVARLPAAFSWRWRAGPLCVALVLILADVAVFTAFGVLLLRPRVLQPLQRLAAAAGALAAGRLEVRVPEEGPRETAELSRAFNRMGEALAERTQRLEKSVEELRESNHRLRRAREGLERAERLAAVGQLAAGVAHEVGNPIGAMLALLELVRREPGLPPGAREHLERAGREGERVRRILRQLLNFARPGRGRRVRFDLRAVVAEVVTLLATQPQAGSAAIELAGPGGEGDERPLWVHGDPEATTQVTLNLLLNALDAVSGVPDARVRVELERSSSPERSQWAECRVLDNGRGVAPEDRERIFRPFFSTKPAGAGTGLGLANSLRLAEAQGGKLELAGEAPPGFKTAFVLRLPTD